MAKRHQPESQVEGRLLDLLQPIANLATPRPLSRPLAFVQPAQIVALFPGRQSDRCGRRASSLHPDLGERPFRSAVICLTSLLLRDDELAASPKERRTATRKLRAAVSRMERAADLLDEVGGALRTQRSLADAPRQLADLFDHVADDQQEARAEKAGRGTDPATDAALAVVDSLDPLWAPMQKCSPYPKARCGFGLRSMSKKGSSKTSSSRLAEA